MINICFRIFSIPSQCNLKLNIIDFKIYIIPGRIVWITVRSNAVAVNMYMLKSLYGTPDPAHDHNNGFLIIIITVKSSKVGRSGFLRRHFSVSRDLPVPWGVCGGVTRTEFIIAYRQRGTYRKFDLTRQTLA